jgi:16S rRNA (cytidine1402-2'-O)-methyltransferase
MSQKGNLVLIPCPVVEGKIESLSTETIERLHQTTYFYVEKAKTARHFIKASQHPRPIQEMVIHEINNFKTENEDFLRNVFNGHDIGIISEAGCPGIADPGSDAVAWGHKNGIKVIPLVGPSSILMALMASGFNGQDFAFNGYLPNKKPELIPQLKNLETKVQRTGQSQIFMETPYRNAFILEVCSQTLNSNTRLCVACDINAETETILQMRIQDWKKEDFSVFHKRPCIFILG